MGKADNHISILVDKYGDMILKIAYTYLKNMADAEDALQDVFLKIIEKMPIFDDEAHEKAWIIRVTINTCKNRLNLFWNRNTCSINSARETGSFDSYSEDNSVLNAVMALPEKYRIAVYLYYYEGYTTPEISQLIGTKESTLRSILHRARKQLKSVLKEAYDFE